MNDITNSFRIVCLDDNNNSMDDSNDDNKNTIYISWYSNINQVPLQDKDTSLYVICQELFDTLPIHSFEKTNDGSWKERLVDVDIIDNPAYQTITNIQKRPRLRFVLSKHETNELQNLLTPIVPIMQSYNNYDDIPTGSIVELSKDGDALIQDIQSRVQKCNYGSSALIIDYGYYDTELLTQSSIRAFRQHHNVHPLTTPGLVDLTADVNFISLQRALLSSSSSNTNNNDNDNTTNTTANNNIKVLGPVAQQYFLVQLGIVDRVEKIIDDKNTTDEQAEDIVNALERLISDEKGMMGNTYKVMSIVKTKKILGEKSIPGF